MTCKARREFPKIGSVSVSWGTIPIVPLLYGTIGIVLHEIAKLRRYPPLAFAKKVREVLDG